MPPTVWKVRIYDIESLLFCFDTGPQGSGWPETHCVASTELLLVLPPHPKCWDYRCSLPHLVLCLCWGPQGFLRTRQALSQLCPILSPYSIKHSGNHDLSERLFSRADGSAALAGFPPVSFHQHPPRPTVWSKRNQDPSETDEPLCSESQNESGIACCYQKVRILFKNLLETVAEDQRAWRTGLCVWCWDCLSTQYSFFFEETWNKIGLWGTNGFIIISLKEN